MCLAAAARTAERCGVCNPAAYVLCELTTLRKAQNVSDGMTNPVRLGYGYSDMISNIPDVRVHRLPA